MRASECGELGAGNPALAAVQRAMGNYNMDHDLLSLEMPTMVMGGDADPLTPVKACQIIKEHLPHAQYKIFVGQGHNMLQESDEVRECIIAFLRGCNLNLTTSAAPILLSKL